jgi:hypothetical protein
VSAISAFQSAGPAIASTVRWWASWNIITAPRVIWVIWSGFHWRRSSVGVFE